MQSRAIFYIWAIFILPADSTDRQADKKIQNIKTKVTKQRCHKNVR